MNIIFFGSSTFAVPFLSALLNTRHTLSCVVTCPDKKQGRHMRLTPTPVKILAGYRSLNIFQPEDINSRDSAAYLTGLKPGLFVVAAYGQILSPEILNIPSILAINAHASLLPKYRGAAPINWCLIKGDKETGVTIIEMSEKMDAGAILLQKSIPIEEEDDYLSLVPKISRQGTELLLDSLIAIENKNFKLNPQNEKRATFAPRLKKEDGLIHWKKPAREVLNLIRGCQHWPGAYTYYQGKLLKIYRAKAGRNPPGFTARFLSAGKPGQILAVTNEEIIVATGNKTLCIEELQIEGKKAMKTRDFLLGHKLKAGESLG